MGEYEVEGYGVKSEYDQPYLKGADFDPNVAFAKAGDPEAQAEHQTVLAETAVGEHFVVQAVSKPEDATYPDTVPVGVVPYSKEPEGTESSLDDNGDPDIKTLDDDPEPSKFTGPADDK